MIRLIRVLVALVLVVSACGTATQQQAQPETSTSIVSPTTVAASVAPATSTTMTTQPSATQAPPTTEPPPQVRTGAQVLADSSFSQLAGLRVGLIAHQNSVVQVEDVQIHLSDAMVATDDVELVALFGPEHGVRGTADAGELVEDEVDPETGLPVFSLFGNTRQPTPEMLEGIDVLVYDLQDVGTRYYTYISTMGLAMQAAANEGIGFVVLDRPNPLGGAIGGGVLEVERTSFVGQYPIPDQYGLTAGELALQIVEHEWLSGLDGLDLDVVTADGWTRDMLWPETGLEWIAPSPAIDTVESALLYPATIWFEASAMSYGRGTDEPFRVLGAPWLDADAAANELRERSLPGVTFETTEVTPTSAGLTVEPAFADQTIPAVRIRVEDPSLVEATELGVHLLDVMSTQANAAGATFLSRPAWLDQLSGNALLRSVVESGAIDVDAVVEAQELQRLNGAAQLSDGLLYE